MNLLRRFPMLAFALSLIAIAGFCVATESFGLLVVAGALAAMSWYVTEGPRGRTLPRWVANILLIAALLNATSEWVLRGGADDVTSIVGRFTLWLTIIKLYEGKGVRDYGQLLALTAVLMTAGALQTVQLSYAILLLAYVLLGLVVLLLFQMHIGYERARVLRRTEAPESARFVPPVLAVTGRNPPRAFASLGVVMACGGLVISLAVFVIFPRGLLHSDSMLSGLARRTTGFSEDVRLNESTRISESRREAFTLQMLDPGGTPIRFPEPLRLRGAVLNQYSPREGRWVTSRSAQSTVRYIQTRGGDGFVPLGSPPVDERVNTYTQIVTMRSMATETIFASYAPVSLACDDNRVFTFETATLGLRDTRGNQLGAYSRYAVRVQPFASAATMRALAGEAGAQPSVAGYHSDLVLAEAKRVLRDRSLELFPPENAPAEVKWRHRLSIARAFADELQSSRYVYTTDLSDFTLARDDDPTVAFLTRHRFGHCEHFASAMAALCRSVGVEARLVTGFIAMEYDESAQHYIVRESNAHAWVEVRSGDYTWATFDPTPPDTLQALNDSRRSWIDHWRWMYDRIEFTWNNRFVGFDSATQATLAERVGGGWRAQVGGVIESIRQFISQVNAFFRLGPAGSIWLGLVGVVVVVAIITVVKLTRRSAQIRRRIGLHGRMPIRDVAFYVDLLTVLERARLPKPEWQPPLEFAAAVARQRPEIGEQVRDVVESFYRVRYGAVPLSAADAARLRGTIAAVAGALRVRPPR